jgi:hypothetical protein
MPEPFSGAWRGLTQGLQLGGQVELMRERHAALEEQRKLRATQEQRQRLDVYLKSIQAVSQNPELYDSIAAALGPHGITLDPALKTAGEQGRIAEQTMMKLATGTPIDQLTPEERTNPYLRKIAFGSTPSAQIFVDSLKRGRNAQAVGAFRATVKGYIDGGMPEPQAFQQGLLDHPEVMGLPGIERAQPARPSFEQTERAGGRLQIQNLMDLWRRGRIETGTLSDELLSTPGGREFLQAHPEISAQTEEGKALARKRGEYRALTEPMAPGAPQDLADVSPWQPAPVPESPFGVDLGLEVPPEAAAPLPSELGAPAPPLRGMDVEAEAAGRREAAVQAQRPAPARAGAAQPPFEHYLRQATGRTDASPANTTIEEQRLARELQIEDLGRVAAARGEGQVQIITDAEGNLRAVQPRAGTAGAPITGPTGEAIKRPVPKAARASLSEVARGAMALDVPRPGSPQEAQDPARVAQVRAALVARYQTELGARPGDAQVIANMMLRRAGYTQEAIRQASVAVPGAAPPAAAPPGAVPTPAPPTAAPPRPRAGGLSTPQQLRQQTEQIVAELYPGRRYQDLTPQEKQAVHARLQGR